jgi:hypothetical protein
MRENQRKKRETRAFSIFFFCLACLPWKITLYFKEPTSRSQGNFLSRSSIQSITHIPQGAKKPKENFSFF